MFPSADKLDRLLRQSHDIATQVSQLHTGMQQLVAARLQDTRSRYSAEIRNPSATSVTLTTPTNNAVIVTTILIVVGTGVGTLTLQLGNTTWPTIPNPSTGIVLINLDDSGGLFLDNTSTISVTSQNVGDLYLRIAGRQVGNAGAIA